MTIKCYLKKKSKWKQSKLEQNSIEVCHHVHRYIKLLLLQVSDVIFKEYKK